MRRTATHYGGTLLLRKRKMYDLRLTSGRNSRNILESDTKKSSVAQYPTSGLVRISAENLD